MFHRAKYVIIDDGVLFLPIVFSELQQHSDVVYAVANSSAINNGARNIVAGAGFCHIDGGEYKCYGESVSLGVKSRGETDAKILNKYLGGKWDDL